MASVVCLNLPYGETKRVPEDARKISGSGDELTRMARLTRSDVFSHPDGSYYITFKVGPNRFPMHFGSRIHATESLRIFTDEQVALRKMTASLKEQMRVARLKVPEAPIDESQIHQAIQVDRALFDGEVATPDEPYAYTRNFKQKLLGNPALGGIIQGRVILKNFGPEGQMMLRMLERNTDIYHRLQGERQAILEPLLAELTPYERAEGLYRVLHPELGLEPTEPVRPRAIEIAQIVQKLIFDRDYETARALSVPVAPRVEGIYVPRVHNLEALADVEYLQNAANKLVRDGKASTFDQAVQMLEASEFGTLRHRAVREIIDAHKARGHDIGPTEAGHILDRFVRQNTSFHSGHLEKERLGSLEPITDVGVAWIVGGQRNAKRLAEAAVFGPNYDKAYALIDTIQNNPNLGVREAQYTKELFDLEVGRTRVEMPDWLKGLLSHQAMKLSFAFLANSTQNFNTLLKVGFRPFVEGLRTTLREDVPAALRGEMGAITGPMRVARNHAKLIGASATDVLSVFDRSQLEEILSVDDLRRLHNPAMQAYTGTIKGITSIFNMVEIVNRNWAGRAGEAYFRQQLDDLADPLRAAQAIRRLDSIGMPGTVVQRLLTENNQGMLNEMEMLAGKRVSDLTQFTALPRDRGTWAAHPLGSMLFQFKNFATRQGEFMAEELFGRYNDPARRARAWGLLTTLAPGLGLGVTWAREKLYGESISGDMMRTALADGPFMTRVSAYLGLVASMGTLGILADIAATAYSGNMFALNQFALSPSMATGINIASLVAASARAISNGDMGEMDEGYRAISREFGGVGTVVRRAISGEE